MRTPRSLALPAAALLVVLVVVAAACGSSGSSAGSATTTSTVDKALLGATNQATGTPLKVGYIYAGQTQAGDDRPELALAQATVKYVNEHLGGVAGRPMELDVCADQTTPSGATDCANQMLADKVPVVLDPEPAQPASELKVLQPASVPFFTYESVDQTLLLSSDATTLGNPLAALAAPIKLAKQDSVDKVAMIYVDLPAAAQLKPLGESLYKSNGIGFTTTAVPLGTPDVTPQVQSAISSGAKEFLVIGDDSLCVNSLKALKTLGFSGKVVSNTNCLITSAAKALPGGFNGLYIATIQSPDPKDSEVALSNAVFATYAPGATTVGTTTTAGYGTVLAFARAMKGLTSDQATAAGITATLKAMAPMPMPLLEGGTFQCSRKVAPLTPAVCSNSAALVSLNAEGGVISAQAFDAGPYLKLG